MTLISNSDFNSAQQSYLGVVDMLSKAIAKVAKTPSQGLLQPSNGPNGIASAKSKIW